MNSSLPLRILLSRQALTRWRADIEHVLAEHGRDALEFVTTESAVTGARDDIDIAFISRDITGLSTKHEIAPALRACYEVLSRSQGLRWVHVHSAGTDRDIYMELHARGVHVTTSSGANADVVAQSMLAGLLALARRLPQLMAAQREHRWAPLLNDPPPSVAGQTALLVGWGPIGQRIAALLLALGLKVVVVRRQAAPALGGVEFVGYDDFHAHLPGTNWLLLACPLTERTHRLADARALAALPAGAQLINVSRGAVVVEADLIAALRSGHLGGAFLDVYEHEPLPATSPLWDLPNVIATPHTAGHFSGHEQRVAALFLDNLARWCTGRALVNLAHPAMGAAPARP
ncbi:NAD(P)-dependent oxidoreductase [Hylemonella gracilis]|uniref:NAD(P)-dependent oxidoreductase n=1 Tax=Hylemonella gracilis TaxID=80880 RepID=UPI001F610053|nr:NAD(P)-dependent oxidoreductase [Hylemonella gracilis]